jgi:hypothetical protein
MGHIIDFTGLPGIELMAVAASIAIGRNFFAQRVISPPRALPT